MPSLRATACAVVRLSPVSMTMRMPSARKRGERLRGGRLDRIGDGDDAGEPCRRRRRRSRLRRRARRRSACAASGAVSIPSSARKLALPSAIALVRRPGRRRPCRWGNRNRAGAGERDAARVRPPATMAAASGCSLARSTLAASRSNSSSSKPSAATIAVTAGLPFGQRAGLVDHQRIDLLHALERLGILDQHARLRAAADADHDRHRCGKPERAGAGDDQHADRGDQAIGEARLRPEHRPGGEGEQRDGDHRRHEPARDLIGEALDRRARALRLPPPSARSARAAYRARPSRRA